MNKAIKWIIGTNLLLLSTCAFSQNYKVQFEPLLPVPVLVVPDHTPNINQNISYPGYNRPQQYQHDEHRSVHDREEREHYFQRHKHHEHHEHHEHHDYRPGYPEHNWNSHAQRHNYNEYRRGHDGERR